MRCGATYGANWQPQTRRIAAGPTARSPHGPSPVRFFSVDAPLAHTSDRRGLTLSFFLSFPIAADVMVRIEQKRARREAAADDDE